MKVLALFLLACLCVARADNSPATSEDSPTPDVATTEELRQLAIELEKAPLQDLKEDDDDDDDDVAVVEDGKRIWNPFKGLFRKAKNNCGCPNGDRCECCFGIPFIKSRGCFAGRLVDGAIEGSIRVDNSPILVQRFPLTGSREVCGRLPRQLSSISFCLAAAANPIPGGVASCAGIDLRVNNQVGATMNFQCIDVRGGKMSLGGYSRTKPGGYMNFSVKNPFVVFAKLLGKRLHL